MRSPKCTAFHTYRRDETLVAILRPVGILPLRHDAGLVDALPEHGLVDAPVATGELVLVPKALVLVGARPCGVVVGWFLLSMSNGFAAARQGQGLDGCEHNDENDSDEASHIAQLDSTWMEREQGTM